MQGVIFSNSRAGRGEALSRAKALKDALAQRGQEWRLADVDELRGSGLSVLHHIAIVGGDGTIHHCLNRMPLAEHPAVALLGAGSGNDLVNGLGLPQDPAHYAEVITAGSTRNLDVLQIETESASGERDFALAVNAAGVGVEADVAAQSQAFRAAGPRMRYVKALMASTRGPLPRWPGRLHWEGDDATHDVTLHSLSIANGSRTGGGLRLLPNAKPDDGVFDFGALVNASKAYVAFVTGLVILRMPIPGRGVIRRRSVRLTLELERGAPVHADGERLVDDAVRVTVSLRPAALTVLAPTNA